MFVVTISIPGIGPITYAHETVKDADAKVRVFTREYLAKVEPTADTEWVIIAPLDEILTFMENSYWITLSIEEQ